jgi:hypothetical protein
MWQAISEFVMTYLDPIGVIVGIVIAVPVFWTWWEVAFGRSRRERRWFREAAERPGAYPAILIVDLKVGQNIAANVERFRVGQDGLKEIPRERIFHLRRDQHLSRDDMPALHGELRDVAAQILASGADTLHYFHAGPTSVAALVGAEFANACQVLCYQYDQGVYLNFGPLRFRP